MEFSKDNNLPFKWGTESKNFDAASNEYNDYETFSHDVKATSGAPDFQRNENTLSIKEKDVDKGGILLNVRTSNNRTHHVQMVMGRSDDGDKLLIKQGNFNSLGRYMGSDDPNSMRYLGVNIQTGVYNTRTDTWKNLSRGTTTTNFSQTEKLVYKKFNFLKWNK